MRVDGETRKRGGGVKSLVVKLLETKLKKEVDEYKGRKWRSGK